MKGEHVKRSLSTLSTLSRDKCSALPIKCSVPDVIRQDHRLSLVWDVYGGGGGVADAEFGSIR